MARGRGAASPHVLCWALGRAFGQPPSCAERKGQRAAAESPALLVLSPLSFFPGEPAPERLAHGPGAPARPCGAFRESSRPMSDSKPRRGEARRHTQDPASAWIKRGGALDAKGVYQRRRSEAIRCATAPAGFGPRCAKRAGLCECAMRRRSKHKTQGDDPGCLARFVCKNETPGGWRLARRGSLRKAGF
jgi:hypothetical protein